MLHHRLLGRVWADARLVERFTAFNLLHRNSLPESDPPTHGRLRGLVSAAFGRGHVQRLGPWVAQRARTLDHPGPLPSPTPGGLENFFAEQARYLASCSGDPDPSVLAEIRRRHGGAILGPPIRSKRAPAPD